MEQAYVSTLIGGMNDYIAADLLPETSYARGVNLTSRGGHVRTRPRFRHVMSLPSGNFQGAFPLSERLYFVVGGAVYYTDDYRTTVEVSGVSLSRYPRKVWAAYVGENLLINDGCSMPAVVGKTMNRNLSVRDDDPELPPGTVCAFGQGRVFFADPHRRVLQAGDIALPQDQTTALKFTEQAFLNETFAIRQPHSYGRIMAMEFLRNSESGSGLGQLVVFYEHGCVAYNVFQPRNTWLDTQIAQSLFQIDGCGGSDFVRQINNDLFFRTDSGLSTLRDTMSSTTSGIRSLPISTPVFNALSRDNSLAIEYGSLAVTGNRALFTTGLRVHSDGDYFFDSLVCFDMASFYSSGEAQMTFDGLWTGPRFTRVFVGTLHGRTVTFATGKDVGGGNSLWVLDDRGTMERVGQTERAPRMRLYTRRMVLGNAFLFSRFVNAELWLSGVKTDLSVSLYFRGDSDLWQQASGGTVNAPYYPEAPPADIGTKYTHVLPQNRAKLRIPIADEVGDPVSMRMLRSATSFQFCVEIRGVCRIDRMMLLGEEPRTDGGESMLCDNDNSGDILLTNETGTVLYDYEEGFLSYV